MAAQGDTRTLLELIGPVQQRLEIVALDLDDAIVVVHVMPTALRRR